MSTVLPYLLSGISVGGQYALIAIGYTMVYGIVKLINFAHGDIIMVGAYISLLLLTAPPVFTRTKNAELLAIGERSHQITAVLVAL